MSFPSRAVSFFMTESDEKEFLDFIKSTGDVIFFDWISKTAEFKPIVDLPVPKEPRDGRHFYMFNRSVSARFLIWPPNQDAFEFKDYYKIDTMESSVVGFSRCYREPGYVFYGGIGATTYYLGPDDITLIAKEEEFLKWFDNMANWLRKRYAKLMCTRPFIRVGPEAGRLFEEGKLALLLARNKEQEIIIEGNLSKNQQVTRKRKGV